MEDLVRQYSRDPFIREYTVTGLKGVDDNDQVSQIEKVVCFVKDRVTFVKDPLRSEYIISPIQMLRRYQGTSSMYGDCDDHVLLLNSMLGSLGLKTRVIGVRLHSPDRYDHVISSVYLDDMHQWNDIDPCVKLGTQPLYIDRLVTGG